MNKTLSLCLIVKNAENTLANCIKSVSDFVDEIVIIDTGSTDFTRVIAASHNAKIYDFKWNDNFAEVRNFSLEKINTDWVLILDADEVFVGTEEVLRQLIDRDFKNKIPMYFVDIFTFTKTDSKQNYSFYQKKIRLFPKHENILFEYSLNEEITHPMGTDKLIGLTAKGIGIKHFLTDGLKGKSKRNIRILKNELKKNPNDFYYNYLLGKECLLHGYLAKAISAYQSALNSTDDKDELYLSEICTDVIKILYRQGEREEAFNECIRRENICANNPEYWLTYAYMALREGDLSCAKKCIEKCIEIPPPANALMINVGNITWKPELILGYIYLRKKDFKNAKIHLEKALEYTEDQWLLLFYLGITCKNLREFDSSEAYFKAAEYLVPEQFKQELQFSLLLMHIMSGKFDKANEIVKSMVKEFDLNKEEELNLLDYDIFDENI